MLVLSLLSLSATGHAAISDCSVALRPQSEFVSTNHRAALEYAFLHADEIYDEWDADRRQAGSLGGVFDVLRLELESSSSSAQFRSRVERRFERERFASTEETSLLYLRQFVSRDQLEAYGDCVARQSNKGHVLIGARPVRNSDAIVISIDYAPPVGVGRAKLVVELTGATFDGDRKRTQRVSGHYSVSYTAKRDTQDSTVVVTANAGGLEDDFDVLALEPSRLPPADQQLKLGSEDYPALSCLDIHMNRAGANSGRYFLREPDAGTAYAVQCDMSSAGGGWTRIARFDGTGTFYSPAPLAEAFDLARHPDKPAGRFSEELANQLLKAYRSPAHPTPQVMVLIDPSIELRRDHGLYATIPGGTLTFSESQDIDVWTCISSGKTHEFRGDEKANYGVGPVGRGQSGESMKIAVGVHGGIHMRGKLCGFIDTNTTKMQAVPGSVWVR